MKGWLRVLGKKLSSIKCVVLAVSVGMILIFSACSKWEIPEMLTETEMLSYMRDRFNTDSANQANATIVFRNAQKTNISCSPFRSEKPYIVMEANEMIALLE